MTYQASAPSVSTDESSSSAVSWGAIFAGAVAATAFALIMTLAASGLGLTMVSPFSSQGVSATTFGVSAAIGLIVVQWLSSGVGGYVAGRLRTKWSGVHNDEVYFRDTAHGLLAWAVATMLVAGVLGSAVTSTIGAGVQASATLASGATAAGAAAASSDQADGTMSYFVDSLLRPADPRTVPANNQLADMTREVSRILMNGVTTGAVPEGDKTYLAQLVAARTNLSEADAKARVDGVLKSIDDTKVAAQNAAETARKTSATAALLGALALLIGGFISAVCAVIGGRSRDDDNSVHVAR